jgi:hypothetical protein
LKKGLKLDMIVRDGGIHISLAQKEQCKGNNGEKGK